MRGIGEVARASGLSVSALRFYDTAGVLVPAEVDPATGYRRYRDDQVRAARLIAGLRRVGMPVAEIAEAVRDLNDPASVRRRLDAHRRRLEDGLADAQRELLRIHTLLDLEEKLMTRVSLPAAHLAASIDAVRFAAGRDPELPMLGSILADVRDGVLTLVATDRFRLAVATTAADIEGPPIRSVLPLAFVDELRPRLKEGAAILDLTPDRVRVEPASIESELLDIDYPDHRRLLDAFSTPTTRVTVDTAALRSRVEAAPVATREHEGTPYEVTVLGFDPAGNVRLVPESEWDDTAHLSVNREFLLQALDAGAAGQLLLELDGPIKPLAVRVPGDNSRFSILMPVRR
ncbi:MerR family transcriptional regulator [Actinoplanes solisilvae]|uniref:DNA polymerase III subunit beta family protein n=1 Tax=Actinoplanes solisilvae TaxID=2486853 RepID=UPI000FDAFC68|nr:MerR family transcriptional regulator [Actinoplanes solisilvae]